MASMAEGLPKDVVSLLQRLESVLQLLTRRIGGSVEQARQCLVALIRLGLAARPDEVDGGYSYRSNDTDPTVDRLAGRYISRKVRVVSQLLRPV